MAEKKQRMMLSIMFNHRVSELLQDGYHIQYESHLQELWFVMLRHHNGNRISIRARPNSGELEQYTNMRRVFYDKVY